MNKGLGSRKILDCVEGKDYIQQFKELGIIQFLYILKKHQKSQKEVVYWGEELEYQVYNIDESKRLTRLQLNIDYIFQELTKNPDIFELQHESGNWMVEVTPTKPYQYCEDVDDLISNFRKREERFRKLLRKNDIIISNSVYPMIGVGDYFVPREKTEQSSQENLISNSRIISDTIFHENIRYKIGSRSLRLRRKENIEVKIPVEKDERTEEVEKNEPFPGSVYMDAESFSGCIHVTFETKCLSEARWLYDQISVIATITNALSAATPIISGKLVATDNRWEMNTMGQDDRTPEERDPNHPQYLRKCRHSNVNYYVSELPQMKNKYNDVNLPLNRNLVDFIRKQANELDVDIDEKLVTHLAYLYIRDPIFLTSNISDLDLENDISLYKAIESTNWLSSRLKAPMPDYSIGWRVELRTLESQLSAEQNIAYISFIYYLGRAIMKKKLNFYIPISKADINIQRGTLQDSILKEKFWWRKDNRTDSPDEYVELSLCEILIGKEGVYKGLFNLIFELFEEEFGINLKEEHKQYKKGGDSSPLAKIMDYWSIIERRVRGEIPTTARWIRDFVKSHPSYKKDSRINAEITTDLFKAMLEIFNGSKPMEGLHIQFTTIRIQFKGNTSIYTKFITNLVIQVKSISESSSLHSLP